MAAAGFAQDRMCMDMVPKKTAVNGAGNGVFDFSQKWTNGSTIRVMFSGGSTYVRGKVKQYVKTWEQYANVTFQFIDSGTPDIRIGFLQGQGSWSYVGTYSRQMAAQGNSMNFGWFNDNTEESEFSRTILHEFGHALGLLHEHKNPMGNIHWNLPVVYNYYQAQGWSISEINEQIINKYSVTLSNRKYDPSSIMHYAVPANFTTDGYSVPWNTKLSADDISLISEMYPKPTTGGGGTGGGTGGTGGTTTGGSTGTASCKLEDIEVEHNVTKDGLKGMKIKVSFTVYNLLSQKCMLAAYFYTSDGEALLDRNNKYTTVGGKVSASASFTPSYQASKFTRHEIFIPYDELELGSGEHSLKFKVSVWDPNQNHLIQSGSYYFTYTNGITCNDIDVLTSYEDRNERMVVMPKFTIKNALNIPCTAYVYFYYADGKTPLKNAYNQNLSFSQNFTPAYATAMYNNGYYSDLYMYVPYDEINIPVGTYDLKYFVALYNNGKQFATSGWYDIQFTNE